MLKLPHTMTSFVPWTALLLATACAGHSTPPPAATSALRDAPAPEEVLEQVVAERQAETAPVVFVRDSVDGVDALLDHWRRIDSARASDADVQAHYEAMADVLATHRRLRVTLQPMVVSHDDAVRALHARIVGLGRVLEAQQQLVAHGAPATHLALAAPGQELVLLPSSRVGFTAGADLRLEVHLEPYGLASATVEARP